MNSTEIENMGNPLIDDKYKKLNIPMFRLLTRLNKIIIKNKI